MHSWKEDTKLLEFDKNEHRVKNNHFKRDKTASTPNIQRGNHFNVNVSFLSPNAPPLYPLLHSHRVIRAFKFYSRKLTNALKPIPFLLLRFKF